MSTSNSPVYARSRVSALAIVVALSVACGRGELVPDVAGGAGLMRNVVLVGSVDVFVEDGPAREACARIASLVTRAHEPRVRVLGAGDRGTPEHARVVIGTGLMPEAAELARALGVELPARGEFRYLGQTFERPADMLIATWRDPERPSLPVTLVLGNDSSALARELAAPLHGWKPNVRVLRAGEVTLEAPLEIDGRCVQERIVRFVPARAELRKRCVPVPENTSNFLGLSAPDVKRERALAWFEAASRAAARSASWATPGRGATPCEVALHAELEEFKGWTGARTPSRWNPHQLVAHVLLDPRVPDDGGAVVARALLEDRLGPPAVAWVEDGATVHAAGTWFGRELAPWIGRLARAEAGLQVEVLLDDSSARRHSPHVLAPLRAQLFEVVLETRGPEFVRALWSGSERLASTPELEAAFAARLVLRATEHPPTDAGAQARRSARRVTGLVFSPPAFERANGIGSRAADASLERAHELGASMVAITSSLAAEEDPPPRALADAHRTYGAMEGDLALLRSIARARELGLSVALFPELLSAPGGTWWGSWIRAGERDWRGFFAHYRRFAIHYALLAELAGCDVLSIGGGLIETTGYTVEGRRGDAEELAWKSAGWSSVVRVARGAFDGRLTFLAGSAEELQKIPFWEDLDLVGFEPRIVHRVKRGEETRDADATFLAVLSGTWEVADRVARAKDRPLFVAPLSFAPMGGPDGARIGPGAWSGALRDAAFRRTVELAGGSRDVLDAVLLGRWSTDIADRGVNPRDHALDAENARRVLEELARYGLGSAR